jgi:hypothetical protein
VPETGLEPAHLAIRDPKSRASANFATPARFFRTDAQKQHENTVRCNRVSGILLASTAKISYFCGMRIFPRLLYAFFTCFLVGSAAAQPTKPIAPGQYGYLEIMDEQESTLVSLPTCIAMTLNFYGADSQWTAVRVGSALGLNFDVQGRSSRTSSGVLKRLANENTDLFNGISFEQIQTGIKKIGYTWDRWQWPDDTAGFQHAINAIKQSLDARKPVIIDELIQYAGWTKNHQALLAFGYDENAGELLVMDPAMNFPGKRHIPFSELKNIWSNKGYYHALFTAPKGAFPAGHTQ